MSDQEDDNNNNNNNNNNDNVNNNENLIESFSAIEDQNLTIVQCKRLLSRIEMFHQLRQNITTKKELQNILKSAIKSTTLPSWWVQELHDFHLLIGVTKHGFANWEQILLRFFSFFLFIGWKNVCRKEYFSHEFK